MIKEKPIIIDNFDLMAFWCRDEYCDKTLSEILPAYKEHLKQKKERKDEDRRNN